MKVYFQEALEASRLLHKALRGEEDTEPMLQYMWSGSSRRPLQEVSQTRLDQYVLSNPKRQKKLLRRSQVGIIFFILGLVAFLVFSPGTSLAWGALTVSAVGLFLINSTVFGMIYSVMALRESRQRMRAQRILELVSRAGESILLYGEIIHQDGEFSAERKLELLLQECRIRAQYIPYLPLAWQVWSEATESILEGEEYSFVSYTQLFANLARAFANEHAKENFDLKSEKLLENNDTHL